MYEAFPRSDYYGSSVTVPDIQKLNFIAFRHSGVIITFCKFFGVSADFILGLTDEI